VDDTIEEKMPPPQLSNQSMREKELHFQKYFYEIAGEVRMDSCIFFSLNHFCLTTVGYGG
jgi:hypothetical protein